MEQTKEDFSEISKMSVFEISGILSEFYTTNKDMHGSGFAIRLLQALIKQLADAQREIYLDPHPLNTSIK